MTVWQDWVILHLLTLILSPIKQDSYHYYCHSIFLTVHFMSFTLASIWQLLWQWYDDFMACSIFICLQNWLNISDVKFIPASKMIFLRCPNSANTILAALTSKWLTIFTIAKRYQHQPPSKVCTILHMGLSSPVGVSADIPSMWHTTS